MPTKRRRAERPVSETFDALMLVHLREGDCLLAGPGRGCLCGLVDPAGAVRTDAVRRLWREHREEIVSGCAEPWAASL